VSADVGIVVTAAGSGSRLGYGVPKALVPLDPSGDIGGESSLFALALRHAQLVDGVRAIIVTAPSDELELFRSTIARLGIVVPVSVVSGGPTRQASIFQGLKALKQSGPLDVVLIHDAARALTPSVMMDRVVNAVAQGAPAVIPAIPVADTLKQIDPGIPPSPSGARRIVGNVDRGVMRIVQTPQGFAWDVAWDMHSTFAERGMDEAQAASDDSTMAQWAGHEVVAVEGDSLAVKVTTATDLALARVLFAQNFGSRS
jgi:2-C-methyl-D-erythritol 4-phosphate cytidylyltransferase